MTVLVVGGKGDPESVRVAGELKGRKAGAVFLDTGRFPGEVRISARNGRYQVNGRPLTGARCVYLRSLACHPLMPGLERELAVRPRGLIAQCNEKRALLESLLLELQRGGARLVNSLEANGQHSRKPYQLALLAAAGLPVPRWIATNEPQAARAFVRAVSRAVYKPLGGGATVRRVDEKDLAPERLAALRAAPVLFQGYIEGVSVRAYVVGRRIVAAAEIHSTEIDYRTKEGAVVPVRLTIDERAAAIQAARACGMDFTGVDLIRTRGGGFAVLECNPSPMFAVFEQKTGCDIAGPLATLLART